MLDLRASRRSFIKGLAALAGITVLPAQTIGNAVAEEYIADERIWLDFDGKRHQLDGAWFTFETVTNDLDFGHAFTTRMIVKRNYYVECALMDKVQHLQYIGKQDKCVHPITISAMYESTPVAITGMVEQDVTNRKFNGYTNTFSLAGNDMAEIEPLRLRFVLGNDNNFFTITKL